MEINRAAFGALAVIGVVAAGSGAYLANRHNETVVYATRPALSGRRAGCGHGNRKQHRDRASAPSNVWSRAARRKTCGFESAGPVDQSSRSPRASENGSGRRACADQHSHRAASSAPTYYAVERSSIRRSTAAIEPRGVDDGRTVACRAGTSAKDVRRARHSGRLGHWSAGRERRQQRTREGRRLRCAPG